MNELSELLSQIQRDATALPTGKLRAEIQAHVDVLSGYLDNFQNMRPGLVSMEEMISATDLLLVGALATALFVRELTTRPAQRFERVRISFN